MAKYTVNVGNIGNIPYTNLKDAKKDYTDYVNQSKHGTGRAAGETVILLKGNEILEEHTGTIDMDQEETEGTEICTPYIATIEEIQSLQKLLLLMANQQPVKFTPAGIKFIVENNELDPNRTYRINGIHADLTISLYDTDEDIYYDFLLCFFDL